MAEDAERKEGAGPDQRLADRIGDAGDGGTREDIEHRFVEAPGYEGRVGDGSLSTHVRGPDAPPRVSPIS